jgi:HAD superfamily hydrolase (TIGR01549 family)
VPPAALLDVDGTLVDTNYHHALAWWRAFRRHGRVLPIWRVHRHVGMGGDQLVPALAPDFEEDSRNAVEQARGEEFAKLIDEAEPLEGAHELIADLKERGVTVVLASSSPQDELERYLDLLDARELADAWTTKDDVDATKPAPDLVQAARAKAGGGDAVMIGDTPWDIESARKADVSTICVVTGGFSEQELRDAGAQEVFESVDDLRRNLQRTPLSLT